MMNWYSQLTHLIFSFYREDQSQLRKLHCLHFCRLSRRWGVFQIHCADLHTAEAVIQAIDTLRVPIAELRLAHQIKIMINGAVFTTFPVKVPKLA